MYIDQLPQNHRSLDLYKTDKAQILNELSLLKKHSTELHFHQELFPKVLWKFTQQIKILKCKFQHKHRVIFIPFTVNFKFYLFYISLIFRANFLNNIHVLKPWPQLKKLKGFIAAFFKYPSYITRACICVFVHKWACVFWKQITENID